MYDIEPDAPERAPRRRRRTAYDATTPRPTPRAERRQIPRHQLYTPSHAHQAAQLLERGFTEQELADVFQVDVATLSRWRGEHPAFARACIIGEQAAIQRVERALFERAVGYERPAVKVGFHEGAPVYAHYRELTAPDVKAAQFWLTNRDPTRWSNRQSVDVQVRQEEPDTRTLAMAILAMLREAAQKQIEGTLNHGEAVSPAADIAEDVSDAAQPHLANVTRTGHST